ncbi:MAG: phage holin family protein [Methylococcales bacterium]|nr:phage holin family protein [Methylococcales bacterium]
MNPEDTLEKEPLGQTATRGDPLSNSGVLEDAQSLWLELRGLTHDRFRLAALETQRAGKSLVAMIVAGLMVAVLLSGAWLGLMAAAVLWLVDNGVVASSAILLAVAFNLLLALILCRVIRRKSRYLQFPATLRSLQPRPPGHRDAEKP